jgi:hypothetical protein
LLYYAGARPAAGDDVILYLNYREQQQAKQIGFRIFKRRDMCAADVVRFSFIIII